jgi:hypothetical protein
MSETSENAASAADNGAAAVKEAAKSEPVRKAVNMLKSHPLGVVALAGAAVALVEVELAVGILAGIGATALLARKSGPEARQEVLAKGKRAVERARALKLRKEPAQAAATPAAPPPPAA